MPMTDSAHCPERTLTGQRLFYDRCIAVLTNRPAERSVGNKRHDWIA
jgi:hypothetical protein